MKVTKLSYQDTGYFTNIVIDYLNEKDDLRPFYKYSPHIESFGKAIEDKSHEEIDRALLADILMKQYAGIEINDPVKTNIESFRDKNTFCIVTAHQLNIFTGPLYVIYKSISAIQLCRRLKDNYPQYHFVPVFWLGSEDHDFDEINHFNLFGKTYTWNDKQGGACGTYNPHSLQSLLDDLKPVLGETEQAHFILELFTKAYLDFATLAQSARYYLNRLFEDNGLVVIDGNDIELKKICSGIVEDELMHQTSFTIVQETIRQINYESQAHAREINLFYLKDRIRERIIKDKDQFLINQTEIKVTVDEMLLELDEHPDRFSPNVILRPLFQQKVLPSLAYIGGGGEIAYWLQLRKLFEYYHVNFPVLVLRNSVLWIDSNSTKKMKKLHLSERDVFKNEEDLVKKYLTEIMGDSFSLASEKAEVEKIYGRMLQKAVLADASFDKAVMAEKQNILNSIDKLEAKLLKAQKSRSENEVNQIRAGKQKLFPESGLQERYDNFIAFYLKYGNLFFEELYNVLDPLDKNFVVLAED